MKQFICWMRFSRKLPCYLCVLSLHLQLIFITFVHWQNQYSHVIAFTRSLTHSLNRSVARTNTQMSNTSAIILQMKKKKYNARTGNRWQSKRYSHTDDIPSDVFMDTKQVDAVFATGKNNSQPKWDSFFPFIKSRSVLWENYTCHFSALLC